MLLHCASPSGRCGPCKKIAPVFEGLAGEFKHVVFAKVDVDENQETAAHCSIKSMPTFQFYKKGLVAIVWATHKTPQAPP